jgi:glucan phosphoethanolaminetransferase (alkaline phosphatase superfamily)
MECMRAYWNRIRARLETHAPMEREALPWVLLAFGLALLPNLVLSFWPRWDQEGVLDFFHLLCVLLVPCFFGLRLRRLLWVLWPLVIVGPMVLACRWVTGELPSEWIFLLVTETNSREASTFAVSMAGALIFIVLVAVAYGWIVRRRIPAEFRPGPVCAGLCVVCLVFFPLVQLGRLNGGEVWAREVSRFTQQYPGGLVQAFLSAVVLRQQVNVRRDVCDKMLVRSTSLPVPAGKREIQMLVIGETTRASSLQLNGYERETTPLLAQTPGLLSFKNVIAPAPATILSVPILLTPTTAATLWDAYRTPSVLNVYKAAGYRVYWLSVQPRNGVWESRNTIFSADAHESQFLGGSTAQAASMTLDSDLIPAVQKILARGEPKVLFVLHTMGSHLCYEDRYPPEFNRFPADPKVCAQSRTHVYPAEVVNQHMRNAYDNTICFIDSVLHRLIEAMAAEHGVTSLYYVSDHGENGAEAVVLPWGHGSLTTEVLHVPLLVWLSPEYQAARPRQSAALRDHVEVPMSSDNTFHTMLDLAGLSCPLTSPDRSIASPAFRQGPRRVRHMSSGLADYDKDVLPAEKARGGWRPLHPRSSSGGEK